MRLFLFWRSGRDSNPREVSLKLISSVVRLWQIHVWSRIFRPLCEMPETQAPQGIADISTRFGQS